MDKKLKIIDNERLKCIFSPEYNCMFSKLTGYTETWGTTREEYPDMCLHGPTLIDCEISTICHGNCSFCYKKNLSRGDNMSLVTFKQLASKFPPTVCQIAFGIGSVDANPDLIPIMEYCREIGIIPNITINGMRLTRKMMKDLVRVCGAISVSVYEHTKIQAYQAVNWLQAHRHPQINIHLLYYKENERFVREVLYDVKGRVINPRAVVLLALKQKGRAVDYGLTPMPYESFAQLIDDCFRDGIPIGFDSCTGPNFLHWLGESDLSEDRKLRIEEMVLPCESGCESAYIDVFGKFSPCSFIAGTEGWEEGLDVLNCKNFLHDIWLHPQTVEWRNNLLANGRKCPIYDI